jgi:hypothetical protein
VSCVSVKIRHTSALNCLNTVTGQADVRIVNDQTIVGATQVKVHSVNYLWSFVLFPIFLNRTLFRGNTVMFDFIRKERRQKHVAFRSTEAVAMTTRYCLLPTDIRAFIDRVTTALCRNVR